MQAQRKFDETVSPSSEPAPTGESFSWTPRIAVPRARPTPPSPAHVMWDELAARLEEQPAAAMQAAIAEAPKWPIPLRLMTILGLSLASWGAVYLTALSFI